MRIPEFPIRASPFWIMKVLINGIKTTPYNTIGNMPPPVINPPKTKPPQRTNKRQKGMLKSGFEPGSVFETPAYYH